MKKNRPIRILEQEKQSNGWQFIAEINGFTYSITVEESYYQQLTDGKIEPKQLVGESLKFLLEREKPEQILREFNLRQIKQYFPDYEQIIKDRL